MQVKVDKAKPVYLTEDQVIAELKEAGLPIELIEHMRVTDAVTLGPEHDLDWDPYPDPDDGVDDEGLTDVTPKDEAK
jgi:hypothetical protein